MKLVLLGTAVAWTLAAPAAGAQQEQALQQILAGSAPSGANAASVCQDAVSFAIAQQRYDQLPALLARLKEWSAASAPARAAAVSLLNHFGAAAAANELMPVGQDQARFPSGRVALLKPNYELQTRWAALSGALKQVSAPEPVSAQDVQEVLDLAARSGACVAQGQSHWVSCWAMADRLMLALPPSRLSAVRAAQDQAAARVVSAARLDNDPDAALAALRRYPWSAGVHELLASFGERALRGGRSQWAAAAFAEVITHAADPALRGQGHVGLWLALAQQSQTRDDLIDAMAAVDDATPLPWRGAEAPARQVKQALLAQNQGHGRPEGTGLAHATKLGDLPRRRITLPAPWTLEGRVGDGPVDDFGLHAPWPLSHVQTVGAALMVQSGNRVARFNMAQALQPVTAASWACGENPMLLPWDANTARRYVRDNPAAADFQRRGASTASAGNAACSPDGDILYYYQADAVRPAIAAVSTATGKTLWTTADNEQFQVVRSQVNLTIMTRPAAADGRVFVLALGPAGDDIGTGDDEGPAMMWYLVCLDGRDGRLAWKRAIGWQPFTNRDLVRGGCAVTVHRGAVYCQTNMGLLARCDLRDGALIWTRGYASSARSSPDSPNFTRQGVSPVVAGAVLLAAPRDHSGVLAMRCDSGELLWEAPLTPSDRLLGAAGSVAISMNDRWVAGLDLAGGKRIWITPLPQPAQGRGALVGDSAVVIAGSTLVRIAAATGKIAEQLDVPAGGAAQLVLLDDGTLLDAAAPPLAFARPATPAGADVPLGLPLEDALTLSCESPVLLTGPTGAENFCVLSGRTLAAVRTGAEPGVIWQRLLPTRPQRAILEGQQIVLGGGSSLQAVSAADGTAGWSAALPFATGRLGGGQGLLWAASGPDQPPAVAMIDPANGKMLWGGPLKVAGVQGGIRDISLTDQGLVIRWPQVQGKGELQDNGISYHDPRTGQTRQVRVSGPGDSPARPPLESKSLRFIGRVSWLHAMTLAGDAASGWDVWYDQSIQDRYPSSIAMFTRGGGLYLHSCGQIFALDAAAHRQTTFELQPRDLARVCVVLDLREVGHTLVVVWASTGESLNADTRRGRLWYRPEDSRLYVDVYDRAGGHRIARQELAGLPCYDRGFGDFTTRAVIFERAIAVTAPDGVHVFRTHAGGKAFATLAADARDLAALAAKNPDIAAFDAAAAKTSAAAKAFAAAATAAMAPEQRQALTASAAAEVDDIVQQAYRPVMTPPGGDYAGEVTVALSTAVRGAALRYTIDSNDPLAAGQAYTTPLRLAAGTIIKAAAGAPGKTFATIPTREETYRILAARAADAPANPQPGLNFAYASGAAKTVAEMAALKATRTGTCPNFDISPWTGADNWCVTFSGYIRVPADGVYTFYTTSDDGSCLFIGNARVADNDRRHPPQMASGQIALRAGLHAIRVAYFELTACKLLKVEYSGPNIPRQLIPNEVLFH
ncbi:MAG: PQQ-binding-like beta-propeller repeat protein [Planctomycetaceae bacterium]|nr:PQQ-binding-like beta-propeller repeat protein [Planctomycetaceae bacterium]